jgi:murein DD-endopeptidase MepM/ murein hydrolase activator NlpD
MKSITNLFFLLVCAYAMAQDIPSSHTNLELDDFPFYESDATSVGSKMVKPTIDIKSQHWDTNVFNPFKDVSVKFPVKLEFSDNSYTSPITRNKVITSRFGWRKGRAHKGIDIDLVTGDNVMAMFDGIVRFAKYSSGHGRTVIVRHYNGLETVYAHLSNYAVKANDTVISGQILGEGGTSGNARGSHLHLVTNYQGIAIHPEYLLDFDKKNTIKSKEIWVTNKHTQAEYYSSKNQRKFEPLITKEAAIASLKIESKVYIVKRGDTLSRIALRNNRHINSICKTNHIRSSSVLKIGQNLIIE